MRKKNKRPRPAARGVRFSIAFKTSVIYTSMFTLILAVTVGLLAWAMATQAARMQRLDRLALFVSERFSRGDNRFDFSSFAQANHVYIQWIDPAGGRAVSYGTAPDSGKKHAETVRPAEVRGPAAAGGNAGPLPGQKSSAPGGPFPGGERESRPFVRVTDLDDLGPAGWVTVPWAAAALAVMLAFAALTGAFLMRRMMRPVYRMTQTAREISATDLSLRIDAGNAHDELGELARTFNSMLDRIQRAYEQQNRFVSDASHELRTPLSVISGYANLLRRWGSEDRAVLEESVSKIIEEAGNMQQLVERLLFLARADKQNQPVKMERFCLSSLMEDVMDETRLIDRGHTLRQEICPDVFVTADSALIKQAVRAVLENSEKYTPEGGTIALFCRPVESGAEIMVKDTGVGISEEDLPHIFDRFYKADESRTRGGGASSGLGLSIVKWIVERHGGGISVSSRKGGGTAFTIFLPQERRNLPA